MKKGDELRALLVSVRWLQQQHLEQRMSPEKATDALFDILDILIETLLRSEEADPS